ncbi:MAG: hypothetical protein ACRC92_04115 [Peptostreptococcaceae bacterium]
MAILKLKMEIVSEFFGTGEIGFKNMLKLIEVGGDTIDDILDFIYDDEEIMTKHYNKERKDEYTTIVYMNEMVKYKQLTLSLKELKDTLNKVSK